MRRAGSATEAWEADAVATYCPCACRALAQDDASPGETVASAMLAMFAFSLASAIGGLLGWQAVLVARNRTTVEQWRLSKRRSTCVRGGRCWRCCSRRRCRQRQSNTAPVHPFDLGPWINVREVLGYNLLEWFVPVVRGLCFMRCFERTTSVGWNRRTLTYGAA